MALTRWDPFGEMTSLRRAMDRLLEDSFVMPQAGMPAAAGFELDVMERDDALVVKASLPGVKPEDVNVSVERGVLTISGEMREEQEGGEGRYHHRERRYGRFSRSIMLPADTNPEACEADFEHGVLTIKLPKSAQARARQIPIRGAGRQTIEGQRAGPGTTGGQTVLQGASSPADRMTAGATRTGAGDTGAPRETQRAQGSGAAGATDKTTRAKR